MDKSYKIIMIFIVVMGIICSIVFYDKFFTNNYYYLTVAEVDSKSTHNSIVKTNKELDISYLEKQGYVILNIEKISKGQYDKLDELHKK